ncbi:MAG: hypothetical protein QG670_1139, partial [Thermoproteota archaeon]|nr:hypothetical protein [Thermoproteota archaeon]
MSKIDVRRLIVRRRFKIPTRSYVLHELIFKQVSNQESSVVVNYIKDGYFSYTRTGYFRLDYPTALAINFLIVNDAPLTKESIEQFKKENVDNIKRGYSIPLILHTPLEIAYAIFSENTDGCFCEVVAYPLLYELIEKKLRPMCDEFEVQNSI